MSQRKYHYPTLTYGLVLFVVLVIVFPLVVSAGEGNLVPPGGGSGLITNPLGPSIDSIPKLINAILKIVVKVGLPLVALAIIYVGFLFVKAQGNETELKTAKEAFLYTIIGAGIVLGAAVISEAIDVTVTSLGT